MTKRKMVLKCNNPNIRAKKGPSNHVINLHAVIQLSVLFLILFYETYKDMLIAQELF